MAANQFFRLVSENVINGLTTIGKESGLILLPEPLTDEFGDFTEALLTFSQCFLVTDLMGRILKTPEKADGFPSWAYD